MIGVRARRIATDSIPSAAACMVLLVSCDVVPQSTFSVTNASVDSSYSCPVGAVNAYYDVRGTIEARNGTSKQVTISSIDAVLTLASVKGGWLQKVGDRYDAGSVTFTPASVDAGANATLSVTIPSSCTGRSAGSPVASGDYAITFTITTSAGTFRVDSKDRHRIISG